MSTKSISAIQQKRRTEIISAAITALAEVGYVAASFAEIGKRAGVSKSVVAYHFGNKETLIDEVVNAIYDKGFVVVRPSIDAQSTARGQIEAFIRCSVQFYQEYYLYVVALSRLRLHLSNTGKPNRVAVRRLHKELSDLTDIFAYGQARGEFRKFNTAIMARTLRQALDGVLVEMAHHPGGDATQYANELVSIFWHATIKEGHYAG